MKKHYVNKFFCRSNSGITKTALFVTTSIIVLTLTSCDVFNSDDDEPDREITFTLPTNLSDPLLLSAVHQNGDSVAYYGTRNEQGIPEEVFGATIFQNGETVEIETGGLQSLPSRITADDATFMFDWETPTDVVISTIDNATGERTQIAFDLTDIPDEEYPPSAKIMQTVQVPRGIYIRSESEEPCIDSAEMVHTSGGKAGDSSLSKADFESMLVKVERCGAPIKDARVQLSMQPNLDSGFQLVGVPRNLGDGYYRFQVPRPKGSTVATSISNLCSGTVEVIGAGCPTADALAAGAPGICANIAIRTGPAGPKVFAACNASIAAYVFFCKTLNYSPDEGTPAGTPSHLPNTSPIKFVCSAIKELDRGFSSTNLRFKAKAIINSSLGLQVGEDFSGIVPINSTYPDLGISFSGSPEATSFTASPGNPPAGVGYTASATLSCVVPGSQIQLSVVGSDGYTDSNTCVSNEDAVQNCTLNVPGAGEGGVKDIITITLDGQQIGQPLTVVFGGGANKDSNLISKR